MTNKQFQELYIYKQVKIIFEWLESNTDNFSPRGDESIINIVNAIFRQCDKLNIDFSKMWSELKYADREKLAINCWTSIFNNHYLNNGNKRVAFAVYFCIRQVALELSSHTEDFGINEVLNYECRNTLKELENE